MSQTPQPDPMQVPPDQTRPLIEAGVGEDARTSTAPDRTDASQATSPSAAKTRQPPHPKPLARAALRNELYRICLFVGVGLVIGSTFNHPSLGLSAALGLYVIQHLRQLWVLRQWVDATKSVDLPDARGIWGDIFLELDELQRRNRKRKKKLAAILAEFQASTSALPDGAVVLGDRGEIVWFNRAAQTLIGLHVAQDLGLRIANLIRHPAFTTYIESGNYEGEIEVPSAHNLALTLALRIIPYGNNQRLLIVRDVSELRRLETARRDFVANASHELRTPLTVLKGYLDMMEPEARSGTGPLAIWEAPIVEMRRQAARMQSLIVDMLKLARLEADAPDARQESVDVAALAQRVVDELRSTPAAANHHFEVNVDPELLLVGRETELQSIIGNLVGNAIRYTSEQGVVRVTWRADGSGAALSVADTGIGIAEQDIPRLTERFYRVDVGRSRASGGTGLGLSIVKHALERHEGSLKVDSELGVGSTFTCQFPGHRIQHRKPSARLRETAHG